MRTPFIYDINVMVCTDQREATFQNRGHGVCQSLNHN